MIGAVEEELREAAAAYRREEYGAGQVRRGRWKGREGGREMGREGGSTSA